jgi:hypothetical protein
MLIKVDEDHEFSNLMEAHKMLMQENMKVMEEKR